MRNMSFAMTTAQYCAGTKDVTRRLGWKFLKRGGMFMGVKKARGLKKGEKVERLHASKCLSNRGERLDRMLKDPVYGRAEVIREGFPEMSPAEFVAMFCQANGCTPGTRVRRIEFDASYAKWRKAHPEAKPQRKGTL